MPRKSSEDAPLKMDTKTFLKLMAKRDAIQRVLNRQQKKLAKVDAQLSQFSDWLKDLTTKK